MKAKELAEILLQNPEAEAVFIACGDVHIIAKVIKCNLAASKYEFMKDECVLLDDSSVVRKSWLEDIKGKISPNEELFVHDDTKSKL